MKKTMYFFVKTLRDYLKEECLGLFFSIIYTITVFLSPQISKFIVDEVLVNHHFQDIGMAFFSFFLICIIQTASAYIKNRIFFKVSEKITFSMRNKMLQSLIHTHMEFFDTTPKGFIFSRFFNDSKSISDFITNIFVTFIKNSLLIIAVTYGMFMLSWKITSLVFILLSLYILLNIFSSKKFKEFSRISLHKNDSLYKNFIQSVDNAFLTRIFSLHHYYFEKVQKNLKDIFAMNIKDDFQEKEIEDYIFVINEYHKEVKINDLNKKLKEEKDPLKQAKILEEIMKLRGVNKNGTRN